MVMQWSHTQEAYDYAKKQLDHLTITEIIRIVAEWRQLEIDSLKHPIGKYNYSITFNPNEYKLHEQCIREKILITKGLFLLAMLEGYIDYIWRMASKQRTACSTANEAWVCPYGCHTVSFGDKE